MLKSRGMTFVELVIVLVLVGILAVFALPRLVPRIEFDLVGFQQEFAAGLRYAQKYAFASGCPVRVVVVSGGFQVSHSSTCAAGDFASLLPHPTGGAYSVSAPDGVTLSPAVFEFLGSGEASQTLTITLTASAGSRQVAVIGPTGYVDTGS